MTTFEFIKHIPQTSKFKNIKEGDMFFVSNIENNKEYHLFLKVHPKEDYNAVDIANGTFADFIQNKEVIMADLDMKLKIKYK